MRADDREESPSVSTARTRIRPSALDEICAQAVDVARAAAEHTTGHEKVGGHIGVVAEGDRVVTHLFECRDVAYRGWRWAVTVARAARAKTATVSESALLPGPDAMLAPEWVPWRERLQPGDLGVGDLLPASHDDERLVPVVALGGGDLPAWSGGDAPATDAGDLPASGGGDAPASGGGDLPAWSGGDSLAAGRSDDPSAGTDVGHAAGVPVAGRTRVLSAFGRDDTATRWYSTDHGPRAPLAHAAPATCATCGFFVPLSAPLGRIFGACANEYAPDDGRVVSVDHGCGAHSEAAVASRQSQSPPPIIDELGYDLVDLPGVAVDETEFEPLDHT